MVTAKEARAVGRQMIRENKGLFLGCYSAYFGLTLASVLIQFLLNNNALVTALWGMASLFLLIPLALGILHIHNLIYYKRRCSVGNLFDFYRNYSVSIKAVGVSYLFSMILSIVLTPLVMLAVLPLALSGAGEQSPLLVVGLLFVFLVVAVLSLVANAFMMACYFIILRNRSIGFGRLLGSSLKIGGRYVLRYCLLQLSFIGWILLCTLYLLVPVLFGSLLLLGELRVLGMLLTVLGMILYGLSLFVLAMYMNAATAVFFNVAIDEYERQYPDFSSSASPHIPHAGNTGFSGPVDRYAGPVHPAAPAETPRQEEPAASPAAGEGTAEKETPAGEEPAPERVEAEIMEPRGDLCDVILISPGVGRMLVSMIVSDLTGMEHAEARQLVENVPRAICTGIPREEAHEIAKRLTEAGARVEIR